MRASTDINSDKPGARLWYHEAEDTNDMEASNMAQINLALDSEVLKGLFIVDGKDEAFAGLMSMILNQVLSAQACEQIGA